MSNLSRLTKLAFWASAATPWAFNAYAQGLEPAAGFEVVIPAQFNEDAADWALTLDIVEVDFDVVVDAAEAANTCLSVTRRVGDEAPRQFTLDDELNTAWQLERIRALSGGSYLPDDRACRGRGCL